MRKRTFRHVLILLVLLTLTGCASIQTRVSSCQQMLSNTFSANNPIPPQEHQALMAFDKATQGGIAPSPSGPWPCKSLPPPCQWSGVTCFSGHVVELDFYDRQLDGEIPPKLGNLSELASLNLAANQLSGEIPPELGNLTVLWQLFLDNNQLSGEIPPELGNLSRLRTLSLANNQLSGEIPPELGNLEYLSDLSLHNNQLEGNIPSELGSLSLLYHLSLMGNQLSGPLPYGLNKARIRQLYLSGTEICIPRTAESETWLKGIIERDFDEVPYCD